MIKSAMKLYNLVASKLFLESVFGLLLIFASWELASLLNYYFYELITIYTQIVYPLSIILSYQPMDLFWTK